ncbi:MAG: alpha/beta fold hydrolase [Alphaproteobacteria bacterium]|nr:alpha/beta fold hydrolase [Alphaproteobacteria bacterium]MCB9928696.1 alpha/beta fold hydrolase [Alphaproteobacteria bacterium]
MMDYREETIAAHGLEARVWRKGSGPKVAYFAGFAGLPKWIPMLDALAARCEVAAISLPGFPGGGRGHLELDSLFEWALAAHDLVDAAGCRGATLMGASVGGALALEVAAIWPESVGRLVLLAPFGLFDDANPPTDPWGQRGDEVDGLMCETAGAYTALIERPGNADQIEWPIEMTRAREASARYLWPNSATHVEKRLGRIQAPTLVLWGEKDKVQPPAYAETLKAGLAGPVTVQTLAGAGHMAELDAPEAVAAAVAAFAAG